MVGNCAPSWQQVRQSAFTVLLPPGPDGLPDSALRTGVSGMAARAGKDLNPWLVPALRLLPVDALVLLLRLAQACRAGSETKMGTQDPVPAAGQAPFRAAAVFYAAGAAGAACGPSVRYWMAAAQWVAALLQEGKFLPALRKTPAGFRAVWQPLAEGEAVADFAAQMPALCRASRRSAQQPPKTVLMDFIQASLDAAVRQALAGAPPAVEPPAAETAAQAVCALERTPGASVRVAEPLKGPSAVERFFAALASPPTYTAPCRTPILPGVPVHGRDRELLALDEALQTWIRQGDIPRGWRSFRTCFRLVPPAPLADPGEEAGSELSGSEEGPGQGPVGNLPSGSRPASKAEFWKLTFHLQSLDDPSLLIDARRVWEAPSHALRPWGRNGEGPQELFLADLGRACRIFPRLESALAEPHPWQCILTTAEAYAFLEHAAPLLEQQGFGVLVPSWWGRARSALELRVQVAPKQPAQAAGPQAGGGAAGHGLLGLDGLLDFHWQVALGGQVLDEREFRQLAALKVPLVQVRGQWVELDPQHVQRVLRLLEGIRRKGGMTVREALRLGLNAEDSGLRGNGSEAQGERVRATPGVHIRLEASGWVQDVLQGVPQMPAALAEAGGSPGIRFRLLPQPAGFRGQLRPYQITGFSWLVFMDRLGLGACLADDMGLGKTIQVIALLLQERLPQEGEPAAPGPTLLVCPMSVVGNWQREVARFAPSLRVLVHHGSQRLTGPDFAAEASRHDLVITTYALAYRDHKVLAGVPWYRVVLDEAQNIKNSAAKQTQSIRSLRAARRLALTGTPMENRLAELWSIMDFLNPGYLGSAQGFRTRFAIPIERDHDQRRLQTLSRLVKPFLLRRTKTDPSIIRDLPEKVETKVYCSLTREQASLYQAVVDEMMREIDGAEGMERRGLILATLTRLKQLCDHPALYLQDGSFLEGRSGKLSRLVEMLEEVVAEGDRALVFTQFAKMGALLQPYLQERLKRPVLYLYGGSPKKARDRIVAEFQSPAGAEGQDPAPVLILSLRAGGVGLNLTAANHVFHFDRWWNPAVENQATDRAFRIGQHKNVLVHKFICAGTLEERIDEMIEQKKELADLVVGAGENWITELSTAELRRLFALAQDAVAEEPDVREAAAE
ncbi:MAG: DEAD/DEAH box helicase [Firmicutes bacterium]|nr:DEAD/DEAH box helicase [Bacillota bacterium]